jgi:hypothetical protein
MFYNLSNCLSAVQNCMPALNRQYTDIIKMSTNQTRDIMVSDRIVIFPHIERATNYPVWFQRLCYTNYGTTSACAYISPKIVGIRIRGIWEYWLSLLSSIIPHNPSFHSASKIKLACNRWSTRVNKTLQGALTRWGYTKSQIGTYIIDIDIVD